MNSITCVGNNKAVPEVPRLVGKSAADTIDFEHKNTVNAFTAIDLPCQTAMRSKSESRESQPQEKGLLENLVC